jgi:hypothetical protein
MRDSLVEMCARSIAAGHQMAKERDRARAMLPQLLDKRVELQLSQNSTSRSSVESSTAAHQLMRRARDHPPICLSDRSICHQQVSKQTTANNVAVRMTALDRLTNCRTSMDWTGQTRISIPGRIKEGRS